MATVTTTVIPSAMTEYYNRVLLMRGLPYLVYDLFGQLKPLPTSSSLVAKFRRYEALNTTTAVLVEGTPPSSTDPTKTDITATIKTYGAYIQYTDDVQLTNPDPILTEFNDLLGEQSGQSIDLLRRDTLVTGTGVTYANGTTRAGLTAPISVALLQQIHRTMKMNKASWITDVLSGSSKVGTVPIRAAYAMVVHPHVAYDVRKLTGYQSVEQYGTLTNPIHDSEIGALPSAGFRFLETTQATLLANAGGVLGVNQGTTASNVYLSLVFAKNAFGIVPLRGNALTSHTKVRGSAGSADPLDQIGTTGWKAKTTQVILNDNFMHRLESTAIL